MVSFSNIGVHSCVCLISVFRPGCELGWCVALSLCGTDLRTIKFPLTGFHWQVSWIQVLLGIFEPYLVFGAGTVKELFWKALKPDVEQDEKAPFNAETQSARST